MKRTPAHLECVSLTVPEDALEAYEAALAGVCETVGFFRDHATGMWQVEGVRAVGAKDGELTASLALAEAVTGIATEVTRTPTHAGGWLERTRTAFPEQLVGRRFAIRGTHLTGSAPPGRIALVLDAGVAFGSGEHNSTRGCLIALERLAARRHRDPFRAAARPGARRAGGAPETRPGAGGDDRPATLDDTYYKEALRASVTPPPGAFFPKPSIPAKTHLPKGDST
jgi:hypothetical protein